ARGEYDALVGRAEADMVSLALELTRRIVGRAVEVEAGAMADMVAQTLELARGRRRVEIRVNPRDEVAVAARRLPWAEELGAASVAVVADGAVAPGGCRIDTEAGSIEVGLETQLDILAERMGVERWEKRGGGGYG